MGYPVSPISELDEILEQLSDQFGVLGKAHREASTLPDSKERNEILKYLNLALQSAEQILRNLGEAKEKLSWQFR